MVSSSTPRRHHHRTGSTTGVDGHGRGARGGSGGVAHATTPLIHQSYHFVRNMEDDDDDSEAGVVL